MCSVGMVQILIADMFKADGHSPRYSMEGGDDQTEATVVSTFEPASLM